MKFYMFFIFHRETSYNNKKPINRMIPGIFVELRPGDLIELMGYGTCMPSLCSQADLEVFD